MVTLLPRQRMQRCREVCHSVFALSVFASRLRGRGCFDQHFILPARRRPLPPLHTLEPHHIRPTHQIVFLRQGVGAAGRAAQALRIDLGGNARHGKNWWCVLYPGLCRSACGGYARPAENDLVCGNYILRLRLVEWVQQRTARREDVVLVG